MPTFRLERGILKTQPAAIIAGIDEAGRGPWAGPVLAGAVILAQATLAPDLASGLDDSKKLSPEKRETLFLALQSSQGAVLGVGQASVDEIDNLNILKATYLAMARALENLQRRVDVALVDGNRAPPLNCPVQTVIRGDSLSLSIAAASIVAKVTRDRIMTGLAAQHPGYGWETNMGYGTAEHSAALKHLGLTPHHRRSFAPIRALLSA
ncbi:MAG: ribonuclease HII [Rhodospirillaceae bacterium]|nr:ribonuclease HII [Rhodospirillaceae bacterium]